MNYQEISNKKNFYSMKKIIYSVLAITSFAFSIDAQAQCTPDPSLTDVITNPPGSTTSGDTVWLPPLNGDGYSSTFYFNIPNTIPYSGSTATVNWFKVNSLTDLPEGLSYSCSTTDCNFDGGTQGCMEVSGDPGASVTPNTTYVLDFQYSGNVTASGLTLTLDASQLSSIPEIGTRIFAIKTSPTLGVKELGISSNVNVVPNPTQGNAQLSFSANKSEKLNISVIDIQGRILSQNNVLTNEGENTVDIDANGFAPGVYQIVLSNSKGNHSVKLVVQ